MDEVAMNYEKFKYSYHDPNMIFGNLEEEEEEDFPISSYESSIDRVSVDEEDDDERSSNGDERRAFWESQEELLQATLYRTTSFEAKVRQATKDALGELNSVAVQCSCRRTAAAAFSCRRCRQKEISVQLKNAGFNCVICMSNWKTSPEIPAGQHTYLEVEQTTGSKKGEMKVIIELNFRAEFEMARSSQEYKHLVKKLPQVFVGKIERLRNLVKILCAASKKCMEERKMYIAPWRKHKYMQAKWHGKPLSQAAPPSVAVEQLTELPKQRASMLIFDFVDTSHQNKAVEVI